MKQQPCNLQPVQRLFKFSSDFDFQSISTYEFAMMSVTKKKLDNNYFVQYFWETTDKKTFRLKLLLKSVQILNMITIEYEACKMVSIFAEM